jgi:trimethylamine--corrinoid protein Co-methyltransferase
MRAVRGIEVTEESLSVDVIDEVCRGAGHYLSSPQSLSLMNSEYYYPHTGDRQSRGDWEAAGSLDMRERARQKARHLLATHQPEPILPEVDAASRARFGILLPAG